MTSRLSSRTHDLRPTRALLHPLWLGSLAVLVLNDHVLKGASALPSVVTGKLSDFVGLIVAPVLLAAVLRVRTRRGWLLSQVAVGAGFSAIQLSAVAAEQWSAAMAAIGFPWVITRDITDLVALPALALGYWALRGAMERPVVGAGRRTAELTAAGVGLVCCAATSRPPDGEPFPDDWRPELWTDVYVHNGGADSVVVRIRPLSETVDVDCNAVAEDPGRLLTEPLFGELQSFRLDPDQNFGLRVNSEWEEPSSSITGCHVYQLDVDGLPPAVVFWDEGSVPMHTVPGTGYEEGEARGGIELMPSEDPDRLGTFEHLGMDEVLHVVPPATAPAGGACAPQSDAARLEWSDPPVGTWDVAAVERGADGCFALDLGVRELDGEITNPRRWYMCAPLSTLGIEADRRIRVSLLTAGGFFDGISIVSEDGDPTLPQIEMWAVRGEGFPEFHGLNVAAVPEFECGHAVAESCGTVTRATAVTAGGGSFGAVQLNPGESQDLVGDEGTMTVVVAHSEERSALDSACAEGPDTLGLDLEVVALYTKPASE
ncbi:MAG: hypothetical protein AAF799_42915 [Myxococcota bacterium]